MSSYYNSEEGGEAEAEDEYTRSWVANTKKTFLLADENGDGHLNSTEFYFFLHPEESNNQKLLENLRHEDIAYAPSASSSSQVGRRWCSHCPIPTTSQGSR